MTHYVIGGEQTLCLYHSNIKYFSGACPALHYSHFSSALHIQIRPGGFQSSLGD